MGVQRFVRSLVIAAALGAPMQARAQAALIESLTSQLGVSQEQATGGAGAIFQVAQDRMAPAQFSQLSDAVPGIDGLVGAAPPLGGASGMLGGATSALGMGELGGLAELAGPFTKLGLSPDMASQFVPIVLDYVQSEGGQQAMSLLQTALLGG
jgi:hypothetical protein